MAAGVVDHLVLGELRRDRRVVLPDHHPQAHADRAFVDHRLHAIDRRERRAGVLERRDPLRQHFLRRKLELLPRASLALLGRGRRLAGAALDEPLRAFAHQPRRVAVRVAQDLATGRRFGWAADARQLHRLAVGERGVAARVHQQDRIVRRHLVERRVRRKSFDVRIRTRRPFLLVPAAAVDPLSRLRVRHRFGDHRDDLVPRIHVHQVQLQLRAADAGEVAVALDEPGNRELSLEVDHFGVRPDHRLDLGGRSQRLDAIAAHRDRFHVRPRVFDGDDAAVGEDEIRGRRLRRSATLRARLHRKHRHHEREHEERESTLSHGEIISTVTGRRRRATKVTKATKITKSDSFLFVIFVTFVIFVARCRRPCRSLSTQGIAGRSSPRRSPRGPTRRATRWRAAGLRRRPPASRAERTTSRCRTAPARDR